MTIDDLKCCGNCKYMKLSIAMDAICSEDHKQDTMPYTVCRYWEFDGIIRFDRMTL
jgi:hypothetical protein